jgi:pimeloyl-ACP methyl ester carboxylesterase
MDPGRNGETDSMDRVYDRSRRRFVAGGAAALALPTVAGVAGADGRGGEDDGGTGDGDGLHAHDVTARDGLRLRVWERSPADPDEAVLFVHGATYGGRSMFDPPVPEGYETWLRFAANRGQAAFAVDVRGYGESERPPLEMRNGEPPVRASQAACDVADALAWIRDEGFDRVHLVGVSWGTNVAGTLFEEHDPAEYGIASLVQQAPVYDPSPELREEFAHDGTPYRTVTKPEVEERWNAQIPEGEEPAAWRDGDPGDDFVLDAVWEALHDSGQRADDEEILAPNGTLEDVQRAPVYDAGAIDVPTLVARPSLDTTSTREDATGLYDALEVPDGRAEYAEFDGGTHMIHLERRRHALFDATDAFQGRS